MLPPELLTRFERQAAWQRARASLSWTEKLRLAGELRKAALALRSSGAQRVRKVAEPPASYGKPDKA